jgi:hypothetical protein
MRILITFAQCDLFRHLIEVLTAASESGEENSRSLLNCVLGGWCAVVTADQERLVPVRRYTPAGVVLRGCYGSSLGKVQISMNSHLFRHLIKVLRSSGIDAHTKILEAKPWEY